MPHYLQYAHTHAVLPVESLMPSAHNPRRISDTAYRKLVASLKSAPWMLEIRPIVCTPAGIVLAGNQRLKAAKDAGLTQIPVITLNGLTEEQYEEFLIRDNVNSGDWDWQLLNDHFDLDLVETWGLDVPSDLKKLEDMEPDTEKSVKPQEYLILIECANEFEQRNLFEEFKQRGFTAKLVG